MQEKTEELAPEHQPSYMRHAKSPLENLEKFWRKEPQNQDETP
jgi:hypothetical protein